MPFDRANRTYYVSDERLRAFRALTTEQKLRWVEELAGFLRMAQPVAPLAVPQRSSPSDDGCGFESRRPPGLRAPV